MLIDLKWCRREKLKQRGRDEKANKKKELGLMKDYCKGEFSYSILLKKLGFTSTAVHDFFEKYWNNELNKIK